MFKGGDDLAARLDSQLVDFIAGAGSFGKNRIKERLSAKDGVDVWTSFMPGYKELAHVAVAVLSICPSEATVERSFSIQDLVHSKTRNRSGPMVEAQMFLRLNAPLLLTLLRTG
jgi:hypothetical protein